MNTAAATDRIAGGGLVAMPCFELLRSLCREMDGLMGRATELYRGLAREVRRLRDAGVSERLVTQELMDAGRTASRASELCAVARLSESNFERYMAGELGFRAALVQARMPEASMVRMWEKLERRPRSLPDLPAFPKKRGRPITRALPRALLHLAKAAAFLHLDHSEGGYWEIGGFVFTIRRKVE
jgi:hypothetical protein